MRKQMAGAVKEREKGMLQSAHPLQHVCCTPGGVPGAFSLLVLHISQPTATCRQRPCAVQQCPMPVHRWRLPAVLHAPADTCCIPPQPAPRLRLPMAAIGRKRMQQQLGRSSEGPSCCAAPGTAMQCPRASRGRIQACKPPCDSATGCRPASHRVTSYTGCRHASHRVNSCTRCRHASRRVKSCTGCRPASPLCGSVLGTLHRLGASAQSAHVLSSCTLTRSTMPPRIGAAAASARSSTKHVPYTSHGWRSTPRRTTVAARTTSTSAQQAHAHRHGPSALRRAGCARRACVRRAEPRRVRARLQR
jgi:hypothetical protein